MLFCVQIGPVNLVRGQVARSNQLNISLMQRLEKCYMAHPDWPVIARLHHNYRCHPDILELVSKLFYNSSLKWNEQESLPTTHRKHPYPLVFICSDVNNLFPLTPEQIKDAQDIEAEIITEKFIELNTRPPPNWDTDNCTKNYLITSPCERQVRSCFVYYSRSCHDP